MPDSTVPPTPTNRSRVIKSHDYTWDSVSRHDYKSEGSGFRDIHRYSLLGDDISELNFHTRYFEVQPGGYSSLELHRHPHSVVIIRGSGTLVMENELVPIGLHDIIYIAPETIHQFHADNNEPIGFLCMVDRYRDKPAVPGLGLIEKRITNPDVRKKIRL